MLSQIGNITFRVKGEMGVKMYSKGIGIIKNSVKAQIPYMQWVDLEKEGRSKRGRRWSYEKQQCRRGRAFLTCAEI